jgi:hypothetical protein
VLPDEGRHLGGVGPGGYHRLKAPFLKINPQSLRKNVSPHHNQYFAAFHELTNEGLKK